MLSEYGTSHTRIHTWEMLESEQAAHCWFHHDTDHVCSISNRVCQPGQLHRHAAKLHVQIMSWISAVYEHCWCMTLYLYWVTSTTVHYFCCLWLSSLLTQTRSKLPCMLLFDLSLLQVTDFHVDAIYSPSSSLSLSQCIQLCIHIPSLGGANFMHAYT